MEWTPERDSFLFPAHTGSTGNALPYDKARKERARGPRPYESMEEQGGRWIALRQGKKRAGEGTSPLRKQRKAGD